MARFPITERECNSIVALPKTIRASITWIEKANKAWVTSKLPVECEFKGRLEVIITVNVEEPSIFSITLLLNGAYRIRGLDVRGSHYNKCSDHQRWHCQTHKHPWTESCPGGHAYSPVDIRGTTIQEVFAQFCNECNVVFTGQFRPPPTQAELPGM